MTSSGASSEGIYSEADVDNFTPEFKRLKARKPPPSFEKVIDLYRNPGSEDSSSSATQYHQVLHQSLPSTEDLHPIVGLKSPKDWKVFEFPNNPGFLVVLNPFIDGYQRYWVSRCLHDFPLDKTNITNMTMNPEFDYSDVWQQFVQKSTFEKKDPLKKLRWTTLGYHHDWNTKEYSESSKGDFPKDVHTLSQYISQALGFGQYNAEAAIVNYYHLDSTLAGHTDHSEIDLEAPLFSISFGQTAIFLLGGQTKSVEPMALYLRSGDICVMSGPSRLAYHAVPRILSPWTAEEAQRFKDAFDFPSQLPLFPKGENVDTSTNPAERHLSSQHIPTAAELLHSTVEANHCTYGLNLSEDLGCIQQKFTESPNFHIPSNKRPNTNDAVTGELSYNKCLKVSKESCCLKDNYSVDKLNSQILKTIECLDFQPFNRYLSSSRINLNIRQVFSLETTDSS